MSETAVSPVVADQPRPWRMFRNWRQAVIRDAEGRVLIEKSSDDEARVEFYARLFISLCELVNTTMPEYPTREALAYLGERAEAAQADLAAAPAEGAREGDATR